jgi:hypothetical protein
VRSAREQEHKSRLRQEELEGDVEQLRQQLETVSNRHRAATGELSAREAECKCLLAGVESERARAAAAAAQHAAGTQSWQEQRHQLEAQVVENAKARVQEFSERIASKLNRLLSDIPEKSAPVAGDGVAAVLHTRIHELLDLLRNEGVPVK